MIGVIGGTHLLYWPGLKETKPRRFGNVEILVGKFHNREVGLIRRHGAANDRPPHRVPHDAHFRLFRNLGAAAVIGMGSAGALQENLPIPSILIPDDYIAWHDTTVFHDALHHITPGFDERVRRALIDAAKRVSKIPVVVDGVYYQTRGPRLETRAEIAMIRPHAHCVGMTLGSEATVAKELGVPYAAICTLDNQAHGVGKVPPDFAEIQKAAQRTAKICLDVVAQAVAILAEK